MVTDEANDAMLRNVKLDAITQLRYSPNTVQTGRQNNFMIKLDMLYGCSLSVDHLPCQNFPGPGPPRLLRGNAGSYLGWPVHTILVSTLKHDIALDK